MKRKQQIDPEVLAAYALTGTPYEEQLTDAQLSGVSCKSTEAEIPCLVKLEMDGIGTFIAKGHGSPGTYADLATPRESVIYVALNGQDSWERATATYVISVEEFHRRIAARYHFELSASGDAIAALLGRPDDIVAFEPCSDEVLQKEAHTLAHFYPQNSIEEHRAKLADRRARYAALVK